jgi:Peptidase C65 Otubain
MHLLTHMYHLVYTTAAASALLKLTPSCTVALTAVPVLMRAAAYTIPCTRACYALLLLLLLLPHAMHNRYSGARKVHADGNCLFRVLVFGALESHIAACNVAALRRISDTFNGLPSGGASHLLDPASKATAVSCVNTLVTAVERVAGSSSSSECAAAAAAVLDSFELEIMTESTGVDIALIKACRVLAAQVTRLRCEGDTEEARRCKEAIATDLSTARMTVEQVCNDSHCTAIHIVCMELVV